MPGQTDIARVLDVLRQLRRGGTLAQIADRAAVPYYVARRLVEKLEAAGLELERKPEVREGPGGRADEIRLTVEALRERVG
jgi:DNA-binding IclR family transcriptional regulator